MKPKNQDPNFFRFPKPVEGTIISLLCVILYFSLFDPSNKTLDYFGPLGTLARYMNKNHYRILQIILGSTVLVHVGEAVYAVKLCRKHGISTSVTILWFLQTFIIGFPSLLQLTSYKPNQDTKTK